MSEPEDKKGILESVEPPKETPQQTQKELTPDELQKKLRDPNFLPTHEQITKAFTHWRQWHQFCFDKERPVFEFFNEEHLTALADYFVGKIKEHGASEERPLVILEIGAGNGRLAHFLQQKLEERAPRQTKVIATDSGAWLSVQRDFPVEQLQHDEAMEKYRPDIVICSWIPYKKDFSKDIRKFDSTKEYVLIGEVDGDLCGHDWETWGGSWCSEGRGKIPPYEADGFEREDLDYLSKLQICRTDDPGSYWRSKTVSFKRKK